MTCSYSGNTIYQLGGKPEKKTFACKNIVWNLKWTIFCVGHASAVWPGGQFWWTNDVESLVLSLFLARTRTREGVNGRNFTDPQNPNAQYFSRKPISFKASLSLWTQRYLWNKQKILLKVRRGFIRGCAGLKTFAFPRKSECGHQ